MVSNGISGGRQGKWKDNDDFVLRMRLIIKVVCVCLSMLVSAQYLFTLWAGDDSTQQGRR